MIQSSSPIKGWRSLDWEEPAEPSPAIESPAPVEALVNHPGPVVSPGHISPAEKKPVFSRTPRKHVPYPREDLVIQPPPAAPNPPGTSPFAIMLPVFGSILGITISVIAATNMGNGAILIYAFVSLPMMLFSIGGGLFNHFNQKKKYKTAAEARETNYRSYLIAQKDTLDQWCNAQLNASLVSNPAPQACVRLAEERGLRLWERIPNDDDFLNLRLGIGESKPTFNLKTPEVPAGAIQPDGLLVEAAGLKSQYQVIPNTAIQLPLKDAGGTGMIGTKAQLHDTARALITQLCTHHSPDEVKIVLVVPDQDEKEWQWARWLPHIWNDEKSVRYFLSNDAARHTVLFSLEEMARQREFQSAQQKNTGLARDRSLPNYVFVFADQNIWTGNDKDAFSPLLDLLLTRGADLGLYSLFFTERRDRIPKECRATVDLSDASGAGLLTISASGDNKRFQPDRIDRATAEHFARALASIQLETLSGGGHIPNRASIADLFDRVDVNDLSIDKLWDNSKPCASLAVPFGLRGGAKKAKIDLQDTSVGGFGSHALVGGTTGTGKTQFLQTLILLLATHYKPDDLQFVLIDYKGGNLMLGLEDLPHIVSSLTNIENQGNQTDLIQRLFDSINVEISRRARLLQLSKTANINEYVSNLASFGPAAEPLSHLFIIIDEFAELILKNPNSDLMKRLVSLGQIGRYVGVHLILATQNPGTIVHEDLRNVLNTRICLRMGSREASNQILRRADAFDNITKDQVGRAYIQVGNNDIFESLQVAWGGAPNLAAGAVSAAHAIRTVDLDGSRHVITTHPGQAAADTQMAILARKIVAAAQARGYRRQPGIWLPLLPTSIERGAILTGQPEFDGQAWPPSTSFTPSLGILDDPQHKRQAALAPDFCASPHLLLFGSGGSGKTTLLQSLLVSLSCQHSPNALNLYVIDFGGGNFHVFDRLPHTGAVITPGENERIRRLFTHITLEYERRRALLEKGSVKSMSDYRRQYNDAPPEIFIFLDNYTHFHEGFVKNQLTTPELDALAQIASDGGSLGIHLVISSGMVTGFPTRLLDRVPMAIALELNNPMDYSMAIGRLDGIQPTRGIPGRGLIKLPVAGQKPRILEFQAALPAPGDSEYDRNEGLKQIVAQMTGAWQDRPTAFAIPPLPKTVPLADLLPDQPYSAPAAVASIRLPVGKRLSAPDLAPLTVALEDGPHFWIAGPGYGGKSGLLQTWLVALADQVPPARLGLFIIDLADAGIARLTGLPHCLANVTDKESLKAKPLQAQIEEAAAAAVQPNGEFTLVIAIDDFALLNKTIDQNAKNYLTEIGEQKRLMKEGLGKVRVHLLAIGAPNDFNSGMNNPIAEPLKRGRTGFLVGTSDNSAVYATFGYKLAPTDAGRPTAAGQGFYFLRGQSQAVQFATCGLAERDRQDWIERIQAKARQAAGQPKKSSRAKPAGPAERGK